MAVKIVALVSVKPGKEDIFAAAARLCVAASRAEEGVTYYDLWRETTGEGRFVFNEMYTDDAAIQAHIGSAHFRAFQAAVADLLVAAPAIILAHPIDAR